MPTYDYQCDSCGHKMEAFQSITAKPLKKCPQCKRQTLKRLIGTGAGIIFKGSGFWQTDYRSDNYKKAEKSDSESGGQKKSESSNQSKPSDDTGSNDSSAQTNPQNPADKPKDKKQSDTNSNQSKDSSPPSKSANASNSKK